MALGEKRRLAYKLLDLLARLGPLSQILKILDIAQKCKGPNYYLPNSKLNQFGDLTGKSITAGKIFQTDFFKK